MTNGYGLFQGNHRMSLTNVTRRRTENINLRCTQGSSDKVYQIQLTALVDPLNEPYETENIYRINFQYGRYGKTLMSSTKTPKGVSYYKAKTLFDKLVHEKIHKGYRETGGKTVGYTTAPTSGPVKVRTDFVPQLLNQVTYEEACELYSKHSEDCWVQTKWDGERRGVLVTDKVIASNRTGFQVDIQQTIADACLTLTKDWDDPLEFDSEDMGGHLRIFDILHNGGDDLRTQMFSRRASLLRPIKMMIRQLGLQNQLKVDVPYKPVSMSDFQAYIADARTNKEEGIVIRIGEGIYLSGKPNSGGTCFKLKFVEDATVIVGKVHPTKRSIQMKLLDKTSNGWILVGNCAIPANKTIPSQGDMVDVKYLYAYKGGSLYQPIYKGPRTDLDRNNLTTAQLKYKKEESSA